MRLESALIVAQELVDLSAEIRPHYAGRKVVGVRQTGTWIVEMDLDNGESMRFVGLFAHRIIGEINKQYPLESVKQ